VFNDRKFLVSWGSRTKIDSDKQSSKQSDFGVDFDWIEIFCESSYTVHLSNADGYTTDDILYLWKFQDPVQIAPGINFINTLYE